MTIQNGDRVYFPSGISTVTAYQTAQDAIDEIDRTGMWGTRDTSIPVYVRRLFGNKNGSMIELSSPSSATSVWAIGYSLTSSGSTVGFLDMSELDRAAMVANSGSTGGGSGSVNFDNIGLNFTTMITLGGAGMRINPANMPNSYSISLTVSHKGHNQSTYIPVSVSGIDSDTRVNINESYFEHVLLAMGDKDHIVGTVDAKLLRYNDIVDTKSWSVTIFRGNIGGPETTDANNPISVTKEKFGASNVAYRGISVLVFNFAYVEPGFGSLTSLRVQDKDGRGWDLLNSNINKVGRNTYRGRINASGNTWMTAPVTLDLVAKNSVGQTTTIATNIFTFTVVEYGGMGISSFTSVDRKDTSVSVAGNGTYDSNITSLPKYTLSLIDSSGSTVETTTSKATTSDGTDKWKISHTFNDIAPDSSYTIQIKLVDDLNMNISQSINIGGSAVPLSLGKYGAGIGTLVDDDLGYDLQVGVNGIYSLGPIYSEGKPVGSGGGNWEVLTQAQYNALTTAEKNDTSKLYLIKI